MPKLTKTFIDNEVRCPARGQSFYPDSEVSGLWLRVTPRRKFFIVQWHANGVIRSITIADCQTITPEQAREEAKKILSALCVASDGDHIEGDSVTLGRVFDKYTYVRIFRPNTVRLYKEVMNRCLGDWKTIPVAQITKAMVETRHRDLCHVTPSGSDGKGQANMAMKLLRAVLNFAADYYETPDGRPILTINPVRRLSQNKSWYRLPPRQTMVPDHKLSDWYQAVMSLKNRTVADYFLFLLLTGLRRNEAACLRWSDVHFGARQIVIPAEVAKNHREHRLPMSAFIERLLRRRESQRKKSEYVFAGRGDKGHIVGLMNSIAEVRAKSGCRFVIHDLRRSFLTMAERLDVPHYALRKLANHVSTNDITASYVVMDVERLRPHIVRITDQFLALLFPDLTR